MNLDPRVSRWAALLVLLLMLTTIYFLFFHWFFVAHAEKNEEIVMLNDSRQQYINEAAKTPELRKLLQDVKAAVGSNNEFLQADSKNLGNAEITSIFKNIVNQQTDETAACQIISQSPTQDREPEQFEKIILRVRMRCQYEIFVKILELIEENTPSLFVTDLRVESRNVNRYRKNANQPSAPENLEIRFDLFAFLKNPIEKDDEK
ncbi:type II secretion system protein GspM [Marinicella meishanensis]|uniref:type II secretion system protein GspM n=1 Tax=Marinicella meishanensis TaxID=2873263 RepID=UPI001CC13281|nr:type II secretion system protein GspM [Marinicella sp. NBU2979]